MLAECQHSAECLAECRHSAECLAFEERTAGEMKEGGGIDPSHHKTHQRRCRVAHQGHHKGEARERSAPLLYCDHARHSASIASSNAREMRSLQRRHVCSSCTAPRWLTPFPRAHSGARHCVVWCRSSAVDCHPLLARALLPSWCAHDELCTLCRNERRAKTSSTHVGVAWLGACCHVSNMFDGGDDRLGVEDVC